MNDVRITIKTSAGAELSLNADEARDLYKQLGYMLGPTVRGVPWQPPHQAPRPLRVTVWP